MATYDIRIDWNNDGDYSDSGENITSRTLQTQGFTVKVGRDQSRSLSPTSPGESTLLVDNRTRDYSPENAGSPLAGLLVPARPVREQVTHGGLTYGLYAGFLDEFRLQPDQPAPRVELTALDALARLGTVEIDASVARGVRTGNAIGRVLDAAGWPEDLRDLDLGATHISWWWAHQVTAAEAITQLVASEGPPSFVSVDGDGRIAFRDRHHRLLRPQSQNVQSAFDDETGSEPAFRGFSYEIGWRDVINGVTVTPEVRIQSNNRETLWTNETTILVAHNQFIPYDLTFDDPCVTITTQIDLNLCRGEFTTLTAALSRKSGQSVRVTVSNNVPLVPTGVAILYPGAVQVLGFPLQAATAAPVMRSDATSIMEYGPRSLSVDAPWANGNDADAIAKLVLGQRAERLPIVQLQLVAGENGGVNHDTRLTHMLARDLSDRVTITEPETGLSAVPFSVESIAHEVTSTVHETEFGCEKIREQPASPFEFDHATNGKFDTGMFAWEGVQPNPGGTLLSPNPFFETDASGWSAAFATAIDRVSTFSHEGSWSLRVTPNGSGLNAGAITTNAIAVSAGTYYTVQGWFYIPGGYQQGAGIQVNWYDNVDGFLSASNDIEPVPAGTWVHRIVTAEAPVGAVGARVRPHMTGVAAVSDLMYIDEARLTAPHNLMILGGALLATGRLAL
jgi:hypothetical protein